MSQIGDCSTAHRCALHRTKPLPLLIVWSGLRRWGPAGDPIACNTHSHSCTFLYARSHTHKHKQSADIFLLMHSNTHKRAKKTQTDRQTEHTHGDNIRNKPSNSTNTKESAEADRYDTAATTNTKRLQTLYCTVVCLARLNSHRYTHTLNTV